MIVYIFSFEIIVVMSKRGEDKRRISNSRGEKTCGATGLRAAWQPGILKINNLTLVI